MSMIFLFPLAMRTKEIDAPSGDHSGAMSGAGSVVSRSGLPDAISFT